MARTIPLPKEVVREVRERCLCFAAQRAARELARTFDRFFADLGLTNGQFSMMVALSGMGEPKIGQLAKFLAMDNATATSAVKNLAARGLATLRADSADRRVRRVVLTEEGHALIAKAIPRWRAEHARLESRLKDGSAGVIHTHLASLATAAAP